MKMLVDKVEELLTEVRLLQQDNIDAECYRWLLNFVRFDQIEIQGELTTVTLRGYDLDKFIKLNINHKCKNIQ